jgi:hypothetical protein
VSEERHLLAVHAEPYDFRELDWRSGDVNPHCARRNLDLPLSLRVPDLQPPGVTKQVRGELCIRKRWATDVKDNLDMREGQRVVRISGVGHLDVLRVQDRHDQARRGRRDAVSRQRRNVPRTVGVTGSEHAPVERLRPPRLHSAEGNAGSRRDDRDR